MDALRPTSLPRKFVDLTGPNLPLTHDLQLRPDRPSSHRPRTALTSAQILTVYTS